MDFHEFVSQLRHAITIYKPKVTQTPLKLNGLSPVQFLLKAQTDTILSDQEACEHLNINSDTYNKIVRLG